MINMKKSLVLGLIGIAIIFFAVAAILDIHSGQVEANETGGSSLDWAPAYDIAENHGTGTEVIEENTTGTET